MLSNLQTPIFLPVSTVHEPEKVIAPQPKQVVFNPKWSKEKKK